jgi:hypothetical protein
VTHKVKYAQQDPRSHKIHSSTTYKNHVLTIGLVKVNYYKQVLQYGLLCIEDVFLLTLRKVINFYTFI